MRLDAYIRMCIRRSPERWPSDSSWDTTILQRDKNAQVWSRAEMPSMPAKFVATATLALRYTLLRANRATVDNDVPVLRD